MIYIWYSEAILFASSINALNILDKFYSITIIPATYIRFTNNDILSLAKKEKMNLYDFSTKYHFGLNRLLKLKDSKYYDKHSKEINEIEKKSYKQKNILNAREQATLHFIIPKIPKLLKQDVSLIVPNNRVLGALHKYKKSIFSLIRNLYDNNSMNDNTLQNIMFNFKTRNKSMKLYFGDYTDDEDCRYLFTKSNISPIDISCDN